MPLGQYLVGAAFLVLTVAFTAAAALLVLARHLPGMRWPDRGLAFALLWIAALCVAELLPAAATILTRGTVLAAAALELLAAVWGARARIATGWHAPASAAPAEQPRPNPKPDRSPAARISLAFAALGVATVAACVVAFLISGARMPVYGVDYLNFEMPNLGRWIQSGSLWMSNQFVPLTQTSTYPNNGDLMLLAMLLPWHDDALVRLVNVPLYAMVGVSVYALARELGARRPASLLSAALVVSIQDVSNPALQDVKPDTFMLATFGAGVVFLVRHRRTGARSDLLLGGLGLGLAFGSRWYGVSSVVVVLLVWLGAALISHRRQRAVAADGARLVGMILLAGGFWLIRNWVVTGNPVYPVRVAALGFHAPFDPALSAWGFTVGHYLLRPHAFFHELLPFYSTGIGIPGWVLSGGALLALVVAAVSVRRGRAGESRTSAWIVLALLVCALGIVAAYVITPAGAEGPPGDPGLANVNARWALAAAIPAAAAAAWAARRLGRLGLLVELGALVGVGFGMHQEFSDLVPARRLVPALIALAVIAALAWVAIRGWRGAGPAGRGLVLGASVAAAVLAVVVGGRLLERRIDATRYAGIDPVLRWLVTAMPAGHRIGIAGVTTGPPAMWAAFGPRLGNRAQFIGPTRDRMLMEYSRQGPFRRALRRQGDDLVMLYRGWYPDNPFVRSSPFSPTSPADQAIWLTAAGFRPIQHDGSLIVYARSRRQ